MLFRPQEDHVLAITQPAHAWISGQLAAQWGNPAFGLVQPGPEVRLAAALHDVGFLRWEEAPSFNSRTGLPHSFMEMPTAAHLALWSTGVWQMLDYGRYPALLVSGHYCWLCTEHPSGRVDECRLEKRFLREQQTMQDALVTSLSNDFYFGPWSTEEQLMRNRQLVSAWDALSLYLCLGFEREVRVEKVPTATTPGVLTLRKERTDGTQVAISPWPFAGGAFSVTCEGRHLMKRYATEVEMRTALRGASPMTLKIDLVPG